MRRRHSSDREKVFVELGGINSDARPTLSSLLFWPASVSRFSGSGRCCQNLSHPSWRYSRARQAGSSCQDSEVCGLPLRGDGVTGILICACGYGSITGMRLFCEVGAGRLYAESAAITYLSRTASPEDIKSRPYRLGEQCWLATASRPDICARLARIASRMHSLHGSDAYRINDLVKTVTAWQRAAILKYPSPSH